MTKIPQLKLSVLDQSPIRSGGSAVESINESIELAKACEAAGYNRYWLAEHHGTPSLAGPAPEIMITRIAAETKKIRVGSGGVMLGHYSPLKVAETFSVLESLYPGRIDLGMKRDAQVVYAQITDGLRYLDGPAIDLVIGQFGQRLGDHGVGDRAVQPARAPRAHLDVDLRSLDRLGQLVHVIDELYAADAGAPAELLDALERIVGGRDGQALGDQVVAREPILDFLDVPTLSYSGYIF